MTASTLYLTVVSGYLVVVYQAGKNLTRYQLLLVSALFLSFAVFFTAGTFGFFKGAHTMRSFETELDLPDN